MEIKTMENLSNPMNGLSRTTSQSMNGNSGSNAVTKETLLKFEETLNRYKAGKAHLERRVINSEDWWKKHNAFQEKQDTDSEYDLGFKVQSGWLHNIIVSKHADAMDAYPEPNILPREQGDKPEAKKLSDIIPCVLEMNHFKKTYRNAMWRKLKTGTAVYKVVWDSSKLNGLGDISIMDVDLLNVFWEPGITDIQKSKMIFHTELVDIKAIEDAYPETKGQIKSLPISTSKFHTDDTIPTKDKALVVEVYYKRQKKLHYCKFVGDNILFASENMPEFAERGFYDHGLYPFVFDALFPVEGSPCGYGFVDTHRNSQTKIDLMESAMVKNAVVGATPRYFIRTDGSINEDEFRDVYNPFVHVPTGNLGDESVRLIDYKPIPGNYISLLDSAVDELRQTSGNTETATGSSTSGVTAASGIAALQEASGKTSRDSTGASYEAYEEIVNLVIELIRQFYDLPRQFRIVGQYGAEQFVQYTNVGLQPQPQGNDFGIDMGFRLPVFDIKVIPQKTNAYTRVSQNELALEFFNRGFFNPQYADQVLLCMDMMEFPGKDELMQKLQSQGTMMQKLIMYQKLALTLAAKHGDSEAINVINQDLGINAVQPTKQGTEEKPNLDKGATEDKRVSDARAASNEASQPT